MVDEHPGVGAIEIERRSEPAFGRPRGIDDRAGVAVTGKVRHRCACAFVEAVRRNEFRLLRHWRPVAPKPDQGYANPNQRYQERQARHGSFTLSHPLDYRQPARAAASSGEFFNLLRGKIQKKLRTVSGLIDRAHRGKAKIKARLIADLDPDEWDLPPKPKWMRWSTYNRYVERFDHYEAILEDGISELLAKLLPK